MKATSVLLIVACVLFQSKAQAIIDAPTDSTTSDNIQFLLNTIDLSTGDGKLLTIDGMGLFYFDQGTLLSLDSISSPRLEMCRLKCKFECEDILMCDGKFLVKSGSYVMQLDGDYNQMLFNFDTELFFMYKGVGKYFNVVIPEGNGEWGWYTCNVNDRVVECVTRMSAPITKVLDYGTHAFCVCGDTVYFLDAKGLEPFVQCERDIVDAAITSYGLFVMTDNALYLIEKSSVSIEPFIEGEMYSLYSDGDIVYLVFRNGDVYRLQMSTEGHI